MAERTEFASCFPREKIKKIEHLIPEANEKIRELAKGDIKLPEKIECLSAEEIQHYEKVGAGHGLFVPPKTIKINPYMSETGILLNYIHENIHYVLPSADENLVDFLTDFVAYQVKIKR